VSPTTTLTGAKGAITVTALSPARRRDRDRFLSVPARLYRDDPSYVPPLRRDLHRLLDPSNNPWHRHAEMALFVALRGAEPVGRIAAIRDRRHEEFWAERAGFFGFFDCIDDPAAAAELLGAAERWVRARGAAEMYGPISPSMHDESGCLVEGFGTPPVIQMPYNHPYYARLLEADGYGKKRDLWAYEILSSQGVPPALDRLAQAVQARSNIRIRSVDRRRFWSEVEIVRRLYNSAWEMNWGFVPLDAEEIEWRARSLKELIDPRFALFAEAPSAGAFEPVGFVLAVPDVNEILIGLHGRLTPVALWRLLRGRRRVRRLRLLLLGVVAGYRRRGVEVLLIREIHRRWAEAGIPRAELSWVLEDNDAVIQAILRAGGRHYKTYRIFGKHLAWPAPVG
jgi:hypothetical protein